MNTTVAALTFRALLGRRRVLLLLPMPALLIGLTLIGQARNPAAIDQWGPVVFAQLGLGVILPLTALVVGSSVLGLEIEDGTVTHLLTKPLPRHEIIIAKLAVAWSVTAIGTAVPLAAAALITGSATLAAGLVLGAAVGALAYTAGFLALSLLTRRPVAVGLVYIILWENLLTQYVSGTRILSVREHATSLAESVASTHWLPTHLTAVAALILALVIAAIGTLGATARLRSYALSGETS